MSHIFGIAGSPRKGATEYAVKEALKERMFYPVITAMCVFGTAFMQGL